MDWEGDSFGKAFALKAQGPESNTHIKIPSVVARACNYNTGEEESGTPGALCLAKLSLISELQTSERPCLRRCGWCP